MAYRHLLGLLGLAQQRKCSCLGLSLRRGITQLSEAASPAQSGASQPTAAWQVPYGRQYLPAATSHRLLTAGSGVSITVAADPKHNTHIVVISPPSAASVPALSGAAQATAAGTWPALPTWLFGFACGGAAATAMTYNHLNHPQPAAATASGLRHSSSLAAFPYSSSSSHNSSTDGSSSLAASVLTGVSYSHSDNQDSSGSSSSGESSSSRSSSSLLGSWFGEDHAWRSVLQQLSPFGARSAHAAGHPQVSGQQLLPTPWEDDAAAPAAGSTVRSRTTAAAAVHPPAGGDAVMMRNSISRAAAAVAPAVVHIVSTDASGSGGSSSSNFIGPHGMFDRPQGSGFIYDPRGFVLTNAHVILGTQPAMPGSSTGIPWQQQSGSKRSLFKLQKSSSNNRSKNGVSDKPADRSSVMVHLADGRVYTGRCIALDVLSDLAVVEIQAQEPLPYCSLGHSNRLYVGDWVVAVGSPFLLKQSVTAGIVSCVERKGTELGMVTSPRTEYIQTDAAINVGNSGGPLINLDGAVIGVNNMKAPAGEGLSFAIPIDTVKTILSEISRHGHVRRPYVGITMAEVNPSRMAQLRQACPDFPSDVTAGIVVTRVTNGSPAAAAGLQEDDVIVGILPAGGNAAATGGSSLSVSSLADALKAGIGDRVGLSVVREQQQQQVSGKQTGDSNSSRYAYVTVTVEPVEAPHSPLG